MHRFSKTLYTYFNSGINLSPRAGLWQVWHSTWQEIFLLRGPFGLGNAYNISKLTLLQDSYNVHKILATSTYHVMKYTEGKNFGR